MKTLHFVLIAKGLTGDSRILFFSSKLKAEFCFNQRVNPLLEICEHNELKEDEVYFYGSSEFMIRFNSGHNDELDGALDGCHNYFFLGEMDVEEDVTHYVANFSEFVDESTIEFFNEQQAITVWNEKIDEAFVWETVLSRDDKSTWVDEDGFTLYQETHISDIYADAYFFNDPSYTLRVGHILIES